MFEVIIAIGAILLLVILATLFRIGRLVSVVKGTEKKEDVSTSNKVNAALMLVFMFVGFGLFFWYSFAYFDDYTIAIASEHGVEVETSFWITTAITGFVFVLTNVLLFYFSFRYQYREGQKATFFPDNVKLEVAWTIVPAVVLAALVFSGLKAWNDITAPASDDAEVIEITGYQFAWAVRYPGVKDNQLGNYDYRLINDAQGNQVGIDVTDENSYDDFMSLEIHIPKGKEILLNLRSRDVLHSVFFPHFRVKMDAVPGMPTHFKFTATKTTEEMREITKDPEFNYFMTCTEICGRGHFSMKIGVVVHELEEYEAWKAKQQTWLSLTPDYLKKVPPGKRELAIIKAGIDKNELEGSL